MTTSWPFIREWPLPDRDVRIVSLDATKDLLAFGDTLHIVRTANVDLTRIDVLPGSTSAVVNARAVAIAPNGTAVASAVVEEIPQRYPPNVMPQDYEQVLSPKEVEDLVQYLLENASGGAGQSKG